MKAVFYEKQEESVCFLRVALTCAYILYGKDEETMKVEIDRSGCIACGLCAEICPEVFQMADDGLAEAYESPTEENIDVAHEAEESCPVSVIHVEE